MLVNIVIRQRRTKRGVSYQLDYTVNGKRKQPSFKTEAKAQEERQRLLRTARRHGEGALELNENELAEYRALKSRVEAAGAALSEAVEFFLTYGGAVTRPITFEALAAAFIESRRELSRSDRYIESLRSSCGMLRRWLTPGKMAHEVSRGEIQQWLRSGRWSGKTKSNHLGFVAAAFSWGMAENHVRKNPCEGIELEVKKEGEISTLLLSEVNALLTHARGDEEMMTYIVLGVFCGLRPRELERLDTAQLHLSEKHVVVLAGTAKTGSRRVVDISDNAIAWLRTVKIPQGKLCGKNWLERWRIFRRECGWSVGSENAKGHRGRLREVGERVPATRGPWRQDVMRHTYASYHYAHHQNEALLKAQLGHWERADTLHRHYRALKTKAEAGKFWALRPAPKPQRLELKAKIDSSKAMA